MSTESSYLSKFHHYFWGNPHSSRKMVFLHGLMGYANNWRRIAREFETDFHILAYDQRGHGQSFHPPVSGVIHDPQLGDIQGGYTPEVYADDLKRILDELGWQKIFLIGHSMGGRNSHNFAYRFPERVERLVIEDIGPDANPIWIGQTKKILQDVPAPFANRTEARQFFQSEWAKERFGKTLAEYLYSNLREGADGMVDWRFSYAGILESVRAGRDRERMHEIAGLTMPTLVVRGSETDELPLDVYEKMISINTLVKGVQIEGAAHWVHFDKPVEFVKVLKEFLHVDL